MLTNTNNSSAYKKLLEKQLSIYAKVIYKLKTELSIKIKYNIIKKSNFTISTIIYFNFRVFSE